jgi:hypothetical protein
MDFPSNNPKNALRQVRIQKKWPNLPVAPNQHNTKAAKTAPSNKQRFFTSYIF